MSPLALESDANRVNSVFRVSETDDFRGVDSAQPNAQAVISVRRYAPALGLGANG